MLYAKMVGLGAIQASAPAIRKIRSSRDFAHLEAILLELDGWLPTFRRMRPGQPWGDVVWVLNRTHGGKLDS
jgi:hypothetical protein